MVDGDFNVDARHGRRIDGVLRTMRSPGRTSTFSFFTPHMSMSITACVVVEPSVEDPEEADLPRDAVDIEIAVDEAEASRTDELEDGREYRFASGQ